MGGGTLQIAPGAGENEILDAAKSLFSVFIKALRAGGLYPDGHATRQTAFQAVKERLDNCFRHTGHLRFFIEKDALLFQGQAIYMEPATHPLLVGPLHRDGLEWFELKAGIDQKQVSALLSILLEYKTLRPDAEGDVVTAFWEESFSHFSYGAREAAWSTEMMDDYMTALRNAGAALDAPELFPPTAATQGPDAEASGDDKVDSPGSDTGTNDDGGGPAGPATANLLAAGVDPVLWLLTDKERETLREMVYEQENLEDTAAVMEMLIGILMDPGEHAGDAGREGHGAVTVADIEPVLSYFRDEFEDTMAHGQYGLAFKLLGRLHGLKKAFAGRHDAVVSRLEQFFMDISTPETLSALNPLFARIDDMSPERVRFFQQSLMMFHPVSIRAFAPVMLQSPSAKTRALLMRHLLEMVKRDMAPLAELIQQMDEASLATFIPLLARVKDSRFETLLTQLVDHPSEKIRRQVLGLLLERDDYAFQRFFHLLDDPAEGVRATLLRHMAGVKSTLAESLLLDYLEVGRFARPEPDHIIACYRALGRCGSDHSICFLEDMLFGSAPEQKHGDAGACHREGAATALFQMATPHAYKLLKKAGGSQSSKVRQAARKVMEEAR